MTIDEAIDRNEELRGELVWEGKLEKAEAVGLGITALRRVLSFRNMTKIMSETLLPGETEE
uniref:Uncharacterized protein n=1 Tax=viral metagenome TaxID=1070528 RepID=A0A6H2A1N1_9ZZZZ